MDFHTLVEVEQVVFSITHPMQSQQQGIPAPLEEEESTQPPEEVMDPKDQIVFSTRLLPLVAVVVDQNTRLEILEDLVAEML